MKCRDAQTFPEAEVNSARLKFINKPAAQVAVAVPFRMHLHQYTPLFKLLDRLVSVSKETVSTLHTLVPRQPSPCGSEFLKAATMQPCGCAKKFRYCARFRFLNPKIHNSSHFHLFWVRYCARFGFLNSKIHNSSHFHLFWVIS